MRQELIVAKKQQTRPYDAAAYLETEPECALYLQAAIDESDGTRRWLLPRSAISPARAA